MDMPKHMSMRTHPIRTVHARITSKNYERLPYFIHGSLLSKGNLSVRSTRFMHYFE